MRLDQLRDGEVVTPRMKGYKLCCCDCGLVHRLTFAIVKNGKRLQVTFTAVRDNRTTAAVRRHQKGKKHLKLLR